MLRNEVQVSNQVSDVSIQEDEGMVASDLLVNNLVYRAPAALSLAVDRTYVRMFPQSQLSSAQQTTVFDLTSGTAYINPYNSYIAFGVALTGSTPTANFGCASAANIINQITIRSRSGTELARIERANFWSYINTITNMSNDFLNTQGQVEGFGPTRVGTTDAANLGAAVTNFAIPLNRLCPFFNPIKRGQKYPAQLVSGLHIEIIWERFETALFLKGGTITGYNLSGIAMMLDSMTLTDDTQRAINVESARNGLEVTVPQVFTAQESITSASQLNMQVRKAVTQATKAILFPVNTANLTLVTADSFLSIAANVAAWQYRLGSLYFPKQAIQGSSTNQAETYLMMLMTQDKLRHESEPSAISYSQFLANRFTLCTSLEKDQSLQVSALPINNSRVLETLVTFETPTTATIFLFLEYISVIRTFIDNSSLSI